MNKALLDVPFRVLLITVFATRSLLYITAEMWINPLNADLNSICHLLALLGAHHILHVSRIRVNSITVWFWLFAEHSPRQRRRQNLPPDIYLWLVHSVIHTSPFNPPILWAATGLRKAEVDALKHMHVKSYAKEAIRMKGLDATVRLITCDKAEDCGTRSYKVSSWQFLCVESKLDLYAGEKIGHSSLEKWSGWKKVLLSIKYFESLRSIEITV
jgi:hypothetical protein